jgi:nicotinate phosphoribosyltransferase
MEVTVSGLHGSFYFGTSEYAGGKENKLKVINMCVCLIFDSRSGKIKTKITGSKWFERKEDIKQMRLPQIINSLLETDMYKFSMGQTIFHQFTSYKTTWTFKCRNKDVHFTDEMVEEIKEQVQAFCQLRFTEEELEYLDNITWIKGTYVDFLRLWQPRYEEFTITTDARCGLAIDAAGTWLNTTMYEIPVLAIVNEVYFRMAYDYDVLLKQFKRRLDEKVRLLEEDTYRLSDFSEFGLRRRLSAEAQEMAVKALAEVELPADSHFIGTSNVYLAKKFNLKPVGTMAHEWIMCTGQGNHKHNPAYSNWYALDAWVKEYGILNGIALTDTITTDCFLRDFQLTYATLFSGVRHDSGDPYEWGDKMIAHYNSLGINPRTKTLLFSDSLDFERATALYDYFKDKAKVAFGIGTFISNDTDEEALNIVMKTTKCNGMDVAKISDVAGKGMCKNPDYVDYLNRCIDYRMKNDK